MTEAYTSCTHCAIRCWSTPGSRCACGGTRIRLARIRLVSDPPPVEWEDTHIRAEEATDTEEAYYLGERWTDVDSIENGYGPLP